MKNINLRSIVGALLLSLTVVGGVSAYTFVLSNTTLNGALSATTTSVVLTSASASTGSSEGSAAVGQCLFVDRELMRITAVSGTTMTVTRALVGNSPHATAAVVYRGACARFQTNDPVPSGNLSCATQQPSPWVNVNNGNVWWCGPDGSSNKWYGTNAAPFAYGSSTPQ